MTEGRVKWFDGKKGYGFIETEEYGDVFVHYSAIEGSGFRSLEDDQRVSLEVEQDSKGIKAKSVRKL